MRNSKRLATREPPRIVLVVRVNLMLAIANRIKTNGARHGLQAIVAAARLRRNRNLGRATNHVRMRGAALHGALPMMDTVVTTIKPTAIMDTTPIIKIRITPPLKVRVVALTNNIPRRTISGTAITITILLIISEAVVATLPASHTRKAPMLVILLPVPAKRRHLRHRLLAALDKANIRAINPTPLVTHLDRQSLEFVKRLEPRASVASIKVDTATNTRHRIPVAVTINHHLLHLNILVKVSLV